MKYSLPALASALLLPTFILTACGGGGTTTTPPDISTKTTPPAKIDFNLPSALVSSKSVNRTSIKRAKDNAEAASFASPSQGNSYAYEELKQHLSDANYRRLETNISLLYLNAIWPQIEENCTSVAIDTTCNIAANTLSFTYTQDVLEAETALYRNQPGYFTEDELTDRETQLQPAIGATFKLGAINYTEHSTGDFTHDVTLDMSNIEQSREQNTAELKQQVKWNTDKTRVYTGYLYVDTNSSTSSLIDWDKSANIINYQDKTTYGEFTSTFKSKVSGLNDGKNGVAVDSTWRDDGTFVYSSKGSVNDDGGRLVSVTTLGTDAYHSEESFDGSGQRTGGKFCDSITATDCSDKANWIDDSNYVPLIVDPDVPVIEEADLIPGLVVVTGITENIESFVITNSNVTTPDINDVLCFGSNFQYEGQNYGEVICWKDRIAEIDAGVKVFQETFNDDVAMGEDFLSYTEITGVTVERTVEVIVSDR